MTYTDTLSAYRTLLELKPENALLISDDCVALLVDNQVVTAPLIAKPLGFKLGKTVEFEPEGWDEENECWDGDTSAAETAYYIQQPAYLCKEGDSWIMI